MSKSFINTSSRVRMGLPRVVRKGLAEKQQESLGWAALVTGKSEERGLKDGFRGLVWDKLLAAHCLRV